MECINGHRQIFSRGKYCHECGVACVQEKRHCPNGHYVVDPMKYCVDCGEKVEQGDE